MSTALVVKRGKRVSNEPTGYGWAVPNYTYAPQQYAPGPMPAPRWPRSSYSVYGGLGDFMKESSVLQIPNWALVIGGAVVLFKLKEGKRMPVRSNPYGVPILAAIPFVPILIGGTALWAVKSVGYVGDWFSGMSGTGLFLGLALGALYGMKNDVKGATLGGAVVGWSVGMAYERSREEDTSAGLATRAWDVLV